MEQRRAAAARTVPKNPTKPVSLSCRLQAHGKCQFVVPTNNCSPNTRDSGARSIKAAKSSWEPLGAERFFWKRRNSRTSGLATGDPLLRGRSSPARLLATEISQFLYLGNMQHRGRTLRRGTDRPGDLDHHVAVTEEGVMVALQNIGFALMCSQLERAIDADDAAGYLDGAACLLSCTYCGQ